MQSNILKIEATNLSKTAARNIKISAVVSVFRRKKKRFSFKRSNKRDKRFALPTRKIEFIQSGDKATTTIVDLEPALESEFPDYLEFVRQDEHFTYYRILDNSAGLKMRVTIDYQSAMVGVHQHKTYFRTYELWPHEEGRAIGWRITEVEE